MELPPSFLSNMSLRAKNDNPMPHCEIASADFVSLATTEGECHYEAINC